MANKQCEMYGTDGRCANQAEKQVAVGAAVEKIWMCEECIQSETAYAEKLQSLWSRP